MEGLDNVRHISCIYYSNMCMCYVIVTFVLCVYVSIKLVFIFLNLAGLDDHCSHGRPAVHVFMFVGEDGNTAILFGGLYRYSCCFLRPSCYFPFVILLACTGRACLDVGYHRMC